MEPVPKTDTKPSNSKEFEIWYKKGEEIFGTPEAGEMMHRSGEVYANDIEMVIFARNTSTPQFFVPTAYTFESIDEDGNVIKYTYELSQAIREDYNYRSKKDYGDTSICSEENGKLIAEKIYIFDFKEKKYKLKS